MGGLFPCLHPFQLSTIPRKKDGEQNAVWVSWHEAMCARALSSPTMLFAKNYMPASRINMRKLKDAQIAAISVAGGLTLVTRNTKDFQGITGLRLSNPWDKK